MTPNINNDKMVKMASDIKETFEKNPFKTSLHRNEILCQVANRRHLRLTSAPFGGGVGRLEASTFSGSRASGA